MVQPFKSYIFLALKALLQKEVGIIYCDNINYNNINDGDDGLCRTRRPQVLHLWLVVSDEPESSGTTSPQ